MTGPYANSSFLPVRSVLSSNCPVSAGLLFDPQRATREELVDLEPIPRGGNGPGIVSSQMKDQKIRWHGNNSLR